MGALHQSYLDLLGEVASCLDTLGQLAQKKAEVVRQSDLMALDEVLKQEQAMSLNLRGLEQRRLRLVGQLELSGVPLSALPEHYPEDMELSAKQTTEALRQSYRIYRSYADMARNTLELNLHQIEKVIAAAGVDPASPVAGYAAPGVEPPQKMKTDFRA